jgi:hypothetical protein
MPDMIVIIPGIMGSTLVEPDGKELWGVQPGTLLRSIRRLGSNFEKLRLPPGISDSPASDGIQPGELIPIPHVVGKLLVSDGYDHLIAWLAKTFDIRQPKGDAAGNLITFPYDWRLSNRFTAKRIETELVPPLEQWRKETNNPDAKFRFICHSMGGLVAMGLAIERDLGADLHLDVRAGVGEEVGWRGGRQGLGLAAEQEQRDHGAVVKVKVVPWTISLPWTSATPRASIDTR